LFSTNSANEIIYSDTVALAIKKYVFKKIGGFKEDYNNGEDVDFSVRLKNAGYKIYLEKKISFVHSKVFSFFSLIKRDFEAAYGLLRFSLGNKYLKYNFHIYEGTTRNFAIGIILSFFSVFSTLIGILISNYILDLLGFAIYLFILVINSDFLIYVKKLRGKIFTLKTSFFIFINMFFICSGIIYGLIFLSLKSMENS
jgi:GT2 family glycosyltransferase